MKCDKAIISLIISLFTVLLVGTGASAQSPTDSAKPVAIISNVEGEVVLQSGKTQLPARWFALLYPRDTLHTKSDGKVTVTFLHDRSKWTLDTQASGKVGVDRLDTDGLFPNKLTSRKGTQGQSFRVPDYLTVKPDPQTSTEVPDQGRLASEKVNLSAYVDVGIYPPVFHWAPNEMSDYKFSLYTDDDRFLHAFELEEEDFDYPNHAEAPLRLTKGALYKWDVTDVDGNVLVKKYAFSPLTRIQIKELHRYERALSESDPTSYVDLLLVQMQHQALDKYLHLLERMLDLDPENPNLLRALSQAYADRGAPAHAQQAMMKAAR